jgi:hypothetical protein
MPEQAGLRRRWACSHRALPFADWRFIPRSFAFIYICLVSKATLIWIGSAETV